MDTQTLETFTTDQLREALANAWSTTAADEIRAELARRVDTEGKRGTLVLSKHGKRNVVVLGP